MYSGEKQYNACRIPEAVLTYCGRQSPWPWLACTLARFCALGCLLLACAFAQENPQEMTSKSGPATFKAGAKEVLVRVVVRDAKGNAVGNLKAEDFLVFDKSAQQKLTSFRMETPETATVTAVTQPEVPGEEKSLPGKIVPTNFIAYLFDDIHVEFADLARTRAAAIKHMAATLRPGDRAAIYTTSGQVTQDFTDDVNALRTALDRIQPRPQAEGGALKCPWMNFYIADLIVTNDDQQALRVVTDDLMDCESIPPQFREQAMYEAKMKAHQMMAEGNTATRMAVRVLRDVVQRMATVPGHRTLVFTSPGFLVTQDYRPEVQATITMAVKANVVVNTLDAAGLYVDPANEAAKNSRSNLNFRQYIHDGQESDRDVMGQFADGTGGTFFRNNNDLAEGFRRTAATPDYSYILAFSPQNLKSDGSYHPLTVKLANPGKLTVTARRGYYAPQRIDDPVEAAKQEIEDAVFSREEMAGIPIEVRTEFFKTSDEAASLAVLARVRVNDLQFKKDAGRNLDNLTVVSAIFDRNGQYVTAQEKLVEFHMHDEFLEAIGRTGIVVRTNFDLKSGGYLVRVVVRDTEGQLLSAKNGTVEIP